MPTSLVPTPTIGELIASRRRALAISQDQLAALLRDLAGGSTPQRSDVSRWERGERVPSPYWRQRLAQALELADDDLAHAIRNARAERPRQDSPTALASAARRVAHEWLITPVSAPKISDGAGTGATDLAEFAARTREIQVMAELLGGVDVFDIVRDELAAADWAVQASDSLETHARAHRLAAQRLEIGAQIAWDAGATGSAESLSGAAVRAAHQAGDTALAAFAIANWSYRWAESGDLSTAVVLARSAITGASAIPDGPLIAYLYTRLGWAHARAGRGADCEAALARAHTAWPAAAPGQVSAQPSASEAAWLADFTATRFAEFVGRCYAALRRPLRATPLLTPNPPPPGRAFVVHQSWLAQTYLDGQEPARASDAAAAALYAALALNSVEASRRVKAIAAIMPGEFLRLFSGLGAYLSDGKNPAPTAWAAADSS